MKLHSLAGALITRLACIVAIMAMAVVAVVPATVAAEESTSTIRIGIVPTEETDDNGSGDPGKVDPPPTEPVSTEPVSTEPDPTEESSDEQLPPDVTPTEESNSGDGREDEAVAPGFVVLVIFTSDGNPTSPNAFACVGAVCQPAGGLSSGTKLLFPDIDAGWRDVSVETGSRTGNASTSVNVTAGQGAHVELTLVSPVGGSRDDREPTPPPVSATGPLRSAPARAGSEEQPPWSNNSTLVSSMPTTGSASDASGFTASLMVPAALVFAAVACGLAAHWTSRSRA